MDSKKIDTKEYLQTLTSLYEKKFSNRKYDVIITADNYAYEFALQNHKKLFNSSNIVFCGVENFVKSSIPKDLEKYITGVVEYKDIKNNIKLIKELIPNLNIIYIISDSAYSSLAIKEQILEDIKEFEKDTKIIFDNQIDMDTLSQKVNSLPQNSAVLFTSLYKDKNEKYITYSQIRDFFNSSKCPVFALNKIHLCEGIVGGIMVNPLEQGSMAAKKSVEVIEGKKPTEIDISIPNSKYYFVMKF